MANGLDRERRWILFKTVLFAILVPGTVTVVVPGLLLSGDGHVAGGSTLFRCLAVVPVLVGIAVCIWSLYDFVFYGRGTPAPIDPPKALVVRGPYRWTRNPMYVGVVGILTGEALFFQSFPLLVYALFMFLGFHLFIIAYEEPTLRRKFGESYQRYCKTAPRWFFNIRLSARR
jgi:protein-S-isoprenylcysteine O-methyltransferase Ste14